VFHITPSLRWDDAITTHIENFRFDCFGDKSRIFRVRAFRQEIDLSHHDLQKKLSRDTKQRFWQLFQS